MSQSLTIEARKSFADFTLDLSLELPAGICVIFGPSGAGKSTLLNLVAGLLEPDTGSIQAGSVCLYDSEKRINLKPEERGVGYVFQDDLLFPHMRVEANLRYGMRDGGEEDYRQLVALLGLGKLTGRRPASLSGGERQRVQIARALLSKPRVLLMDEPLSNLDPNRREGFFPYLEAVRDRYEIPVLYVSHQIDEGIRLADNALLLENGKASAAGPIHDLFLDNALRAFAGEADAGAVIEGVVHNSRDGLSHIDAGGVRLISHDRRLQAGDKVRLRIKGRDVALALEKPAATSVMNILPATVVALSPVGVAEMDVTLLLGASGGQIFARITQESATRLKLKPGLALYAMIKAVAVARS